MHQGTSPPTQTEDEVFCRLTEYTVFLFLCWTHTSNWPQEAAGPCPQRSSNTARVVVSWWGWGGAEIQGLIFCRNPCRIVNIQKHSNLRKMNKWLIQGHWSLSRYLFKVDFVLKHSLFSLLWQTWREWKVKGIKNLINHLEARAELLSVTHLLPNSQNQVCFQLFVICFPRRIYNRLFRDCPPFY